MENEPQDVHYHKTGFGNISAILGDLSRESYHAYDAPGKFIRGLPTGIEALDEKMFGMHPGELIVIGSRPGMGALPLAQRILIHVACKSKCPVVFFSTVHHPKEAANQLVSIVADINWFHVKSGGALDDRWSAINGAHKRLFQQLIALEHLKPNQFQDLLRITKQYAEEAPRPLGLIVIEGFEDFIYGDQNIDQDASRNAAHALRELAQNLQVPILLLASLDRRIEERQDKAAILGDLPHLGGIQELADSILLIWRDRFYPPDSGQEVLVVGIPKSLHGFVGSICLNPSLGLFGQK